MVDVAWFKVGDRAVVDGAQCTVMEVVQVLSPAILAERARIAPNAAASWDGWDVHVEYDDKRIGLSGYQIVMRCDVKRPAAPKIELLPPNPQADAMWKTLGDAQCAALANLAAGVTALAERRDDDAAVHLAEAKRLSDSVRRHNATCLRCHGPAYVGLGLPVCERVGGCLADKEPERVGMNQHGYDWTMEPDGRARATHDRGKGTEAEPTYFVEGHGERAEHPTREGAVAAWREAVLARAKREAGK